MSKLIVADKDEQRMKINDSANRRSEKLRDDEKKKQIKSQLVQ